MDPMIRIRQTPGRLWPAISINMRPVRLPRCDQPNPRFVEIHNEPDGMFWVGSNEDFYTLYAPPSTPCSRPIRFRCRVSAVPICSPVEFDAERLPLPDGRVYSRRGIIRLDFFSAHFYGSCDQASYSELIDWLDDIRSGLALNQADQLPLHVTEWNIGLGSRCGNAFFLSPGYKALWRGIGGDATG